jgi:two-component system, cell cycle sensor histidine kinase and response regulator CckA
MATAGAITTEPGEAGDRPPRAVWLVGLAALAVSLGVLWVATGEWLVLLGFGGGIMALGGLALALARRGPPEPVSELALPDWSVTVEAIDRPDAAVAIIDRAGRMVCANRLFDTTFGPSHAPPRLPVDEVSLDRLTRAARSAWRDGRGVADLIETTEGGRWRGEVARAGRGEDFLVWTFTRQTAADPVADLVRHLDGKAGRGLDRAGFAAAIVDPDGQIRMASAGFALRAVGDEHAALAGTDFVALLRQDSAGRITWAREGRKGQPLTLYYIPVADPDLVGEPDPQVTPSLMLVADAGIGLGGSGEAATGSAHLEALLSQLPVGLAMTDRDGRMLFANAAFLRAAGRDGDGTSGGKGGMPPYPTDLVVREDKGALADAIRRHAQVPAGAGDLAVRLAAQPDEPVSLSIAGVRGLGDAAVLLGLTDSTEETRLKRQVAQATKMQAVGQLAGGVAHDFNNVLTAIIGTCDLMLLRHTPGDSDYDDIQQIRANSNRAAALTRQLLAFSRQQTLRPQVLQLPDVITDVSQMLKRLIGEKVQLSVSHDRDLGPVRADPSQLQQVIVNLAVNARDAMAGRVDTGRLKIMTRRVAAAEVRTMRGEILPVGDYSALVVEDNGAGIAPEHLAKIWEPFFTTKEQGRPGTMGGTGLGLSTVYGIVKQSGGFVFADSELGKGTRFTVYLPVHHPAPGEAAPALPAAEKSAEWAGGGRVLLVEDEDPVRMVAERALTRAGYTVTTAADGEEGLEKVEQGGEFDLVVSDVVMPSMDGPAMARALRERAPDLPILFMSGYAEDHLRREIDVPDMHFIPKPFSVQELSDKVAEILAAAGAKA